MPINVNYGVNLSGQQAGASAASQKIGTDAMGDLGESIGQFIRKKKADRAMDKLLTKPNRTLKDYQALAKYNPEAATAIYEMDQMNKKATAEQRAAMFKKARPEINAAGSIFGQLQNTPPEMREEAFINAVEQISQMGGEGASEFVGELIDRSLSKEAKQAMREMAKKTGIKNPTLDDQKEMLGYLMGGQKTPFDLSDEAISLELGTLGMLATAIEGQDAENMRAQKQQQQQKGDWKDSLTAGQIRLVERGTHQIMLDNKGNVSGIEPVPQKEEEKPADPEAEKIAKRKQRLLDQGYPELDAEALADPNTKWRERRKPDGTMEEINPYTGKPVQHPGQGGAPSNSSGAPEDF